VAAAAAAAAAEYLYVSPVSAEIEAAAVDIPDFVECSFLGREVPTIPCRCHLPDLPRYVRGHVRGWEDEAMTMTMTVTLRKVRGDAADGDAADVEPDQIDHVQTDAVAPVAQPVEPLLAQRRAQRMSSGHRMSWDRGRGRGGEY